VQIAPFACLLGCLYTLGILNRNNEIIAMRASGLSIFQITKTLIIFACLISILVFLVNDKYVPQSEMAKQKIKNQMKQMYQEAPGNSQEVITNLSIYGLRNRLFFINKFIVPENKMEGITILEQDNLTNLRKKIVASYGLYEDGLWRFYECVTYYYDQNSRLKDEPVYFPVQLMDITESPQDFLEQGQNPEFMSVSRLNDYILKLSMTKAETVVRNLKVDLYQRFLMPLTSLVILFVGIPFSLMMHRRATGLSSLGIAIMVGFLYYVVNAVSIAFGKAGLLPPILAVSLSHIIFLGFGLYLIQETS
ncbi:MAG: LptF/LptG family permease, partial [Candidatus Omnitrophota bacterium]|jgi:lipopolysaccharide export system permease protein